MSEVQPYKIEYTGADGKKAQVFFVDRAFDSSLKQAKAFIRRNTPRLHNMRLYFKDWHSRYNMGWRRIHLCP